MNDELRIVAYVIFCPTLRRETTVREYNFSDRSTSDEYFTYVNLKYEFKCECGETHELIQDYKEG